MSRLSAVRAGYMVVSFMVRQGMSVQRALRVFAEHRPPGIYKEDYVRELYRYYHEPLCAAHSLAFLSLQQRPVKLCLEEAARGSSPGLCM